MPFQQFVCNLSTGSFRREELDGRSHLVVDGVMMVEGVHNGSDGPGYYPASELADACPVWDHKPVVIYHPQKNGRLASAADIHVIRKQKVGFLLHTRMDGVKQRTEFWFDEEKTRLVDSRVHEAIIRGRKTEVSTGLFLHQDLTPGRWKDQQYDWVARHHKPDHTAVLPDKVGACSIAKGAGLFANEESIVVVPDRDADDIRTFIVNAVRDPDDGTSDLTPPPPVETGMDKKKEICDKIIANKDSGWEESDREHLMGKSEERLGQILDGLIKKPDPKPEPVANKKEPEVVVKADPIQVNKMDKDQIIAALGGRDGIVALLGSDFMAVHNQGQKMLDRAKEDLVRKITSNARNKFTKEYLNKKDLEELEAIAALVPNEARDDDDPAADRFLPSYMGAAVPDLVANEEEPLLLPSQRAQKAAAK